MGPYEYGMHLFTGDGPTPFTATASFKQPGGTFQVIGTLSDVLSGQKAEATATVTGP